MGEEITYNEKYSEIFHLRDMLEEAEIPYEFIERKAGPRFYGYQLVYPTWEDWEIKNPGETVRDLSCSVIELEDQTEDNLLNMMGLLTDTEKLEDKIEARGLTATEVFSRIAAAEKERNSRLGHFAKEAKSED